MPLRLPHVAVVGSLNVDLTAVAERLPSPGETIGNASLSRNAGGKGANQAAAASRLGASVRMIGAVGDDADGVWLLDELREAGVDVADVQVVDAPTGTALIAVDRDAENQIVVCPGANAQLRGADVSIDDGEIVLSQLEIDMSIVLQLAAAKPAFFALNAAPAQPLPAELIERVDLFIVNESEYALMPELRAAKRVAVTYGGDGAAMFHDNVEVARVPAVKVQPVNTVGAGDAFCAALTLAITAGLSDEDSLRAACAVGAAAVEDDSSQPHFDDLFAYTDVRV
jgi:ribokinase